MVARRFCFSAFLVVLDLERNLRLQIVRGEMSLSLSSLLFGLDVVTGLKVVTKRNHSKCRTALPQTVHSFDVSGPFQHVLSQPHVPSGTVGFSQETMRSIR